jgi:hypothetical protein
VFLALPQVPLTLGNAVIAITEENNRLFPTRPVSEAKVATSTGLMNVLSAAVWGVPMCHGAGGLAGRVQCGARTGGVVVILGAVLVLVATLFSGSVATLLRLFPTSVLGVILFLTGAQLALGSCDISKQRGAVRYGSYGGAGSLECRDRVRLRHVRLRTRQARLATGVVVDPFSAPVAPPLGVSAAVVPAPNPRSPTAN